MQTSCALAVTSAADLDGHWIHGGGLAYANRRCCVPTPSRSYSISSCGTSLAPEGQPFQYRYCSTSSEIVDSELITGIMARCVLVWARYHLPAVSVGDYRRPRTPPAARQGCPSGVGLAFAVAETGAETDVGVGEQPLHILAVSGSPLLHRFRHTASWTSGGIQTYAMHEMTPDAPAGPRCYTLQGVRDTFAARTLPTSLRTTARLRQPKQTLLDARRRHHPQPIMPLLDACKAEQQPRAYVLPRQGPLWRHHSDTMIA
jgi:hypothetical protein